MKKANLILFVSLFVSLCSLQAKEIITPQGEFSCAVEYFENYAISIEEGEDFPTFGGHYDSPLKKSVNLILNFTQDQEGEAKVSLQNPEALPNWVLVTPPYYDQQNSWSYQDEDGIFYQIDWSGTWYFGSSLNIVTKAFDGKTLKVDLHFHDNDSTGELHRWVKCRKLVTNTTR